MPIVVTTVAPEQEQDQQFNEDELFNAKGFLKLESEVLAGFLATLDFEPLFEHADVRPFVETGPVLVIEDDAANTLTPIWEDGETDGEDRATGFTILEYLDGEIAAEFIDEDDLMASLDYYLRNEFPTDTLEDRTALQQFADILEQEPVEGAEPLSEKFKAPFKKGNFRSGPMSHVSGASKGVGLKVHNQRKRMMIAMMKKSAITRVKKGTGYKGGDYKKGPGYGGGTKGGKRAYAAASVKDAKTSSKITKYIDPGRRNVVKLIYKNLGKSMPKNWLPPERRGKTLQKGKVVVKKVNVKSSPATVSKAKSLFAKKGGTASKGKSAAFENTGGEVAIVNESAQLAGAVLGAAARNRQPFRSTDERISGKV